MARQQDEEKRSKILQAAIKAFGEQGFTNTTMKDIAIASGIAPGSIYTYFKDKEVLFISAVNAVWKKFNRQLSSILHSDRPLSDRVTAITDYGFDILKELHPLVRGMYQEANRLNLFRKNLVRVSTQLSAIFDAPEAANYPLAQYDSESRAYLLKLWISGILFTFSSVSSTRLKGEIEKMRSLIVQGIMPQEDRPGK
ncbi:TetR/AcrR family transcriptional regulator [Salinispira pacifica]|uniref:Transcriptional regulator, TetR family n=1 Tax=Salinispira pacifica TaxID=1307761 RepID=V5WE95_9SPIO|nr:TetR/AcrR family transcriptional regulator [Salinispira pacifica]AHC13476.1 Transcriptional regulator, TetR family [Salinispira pacifica]